MTRQVGSYGDSISTAELIAIALLTVEVGILIIAVIIRMIICRKSVTSEIVFVIEKK